MTDHKLDLIISMMQVAGYQIFINNHNVGRLHNILVFKFTPYTPPRWLPSKLFPFSLYSREKVYSDALELPSDLPFLYKKLLGMLQENVKDLAINKYIYGDLDE